MASTNRLLNALTATAFVVVLATPLIGQLSGTGAAKNTIQENRLLNAVPELPRSYESFLEYPRAFERFFNDNFGFREPMVAAANTLKIQAGVNPHLYTLVGNDGWAYLSQNAMAKTADRFIPLSEETLAEWIRVEASAAELLQKMGVRFFHIAVPEKDSIYPEFLPRRISTTADGRLKTANQLFGSDPSFVNAFDMLIDAKETQPSRPLYYQLDSHWNCWGAYLGYKGLMHAMKQAGIHTNTVQPENIVFRDISPRNQDDYSLQDFWFGPTTSKDSAFECAMPGDRNIEMHLRHNGEDMPNINGKRAKPETGLSVRDALYRDWQSTNQNLIDGPRAIVVRNSFTSYMAPFLVRSFKEILFVHKGTIRPHRLSNLLAKFEPDVLIFQYSERELYEPENNVYSPLLASLKKRTREKQPKLQKSQLQGNQAAGEP